MVKLHLCLSHQTAKLWGFWFWRWSRNLHESSQYPTPRDLCLIQQGNPFIFLNEINPCCTVIVAFHRRMLKAPPLISRPTFSSFWTNLGPILMELIVKHIIHPQNSKVQLFFISDQYCHHRSDNYILLPINVGPRNKRGCF